MGDGPRHEATPESAVAAPLQAIGMLGVPVTAPPSGGLHPACACRRAPPREAAETPPCTALLRRAAHVLGFPTGRRSSPGGRRSWGRGRGMPVCRSSYVRTWGTPFSCQQPSTVRRDPLHITHAGRHGACGSGYPACVRTCARAAACGDRQSNAASPFQAPTEPHGPGLNAYRSLTGRFRGPSGCMGQDGVPGRQGSRPPMPFPLSLRSRRLFVSPSSPSAWSPYPSSACAGPFPALVSFRSLS